MISAESPGFAHAADGQIGFALPAENPLTEAEIAAPKRLYFQTEEKRDAPLNAVSLDTIPSSLTASKDVAHAKRLVTNEKAKVCFTGQNPVNSGFFMGFDEGRGFLKAHPDCAPVVFPYMVGNDLLEHNGPTRYIIDMAQRDIFAAMKFKPAYERIQSLVLPEVERRAAAEKEATGKEITRYTRILERWRQFYDYCPGTMRATNAIPRYVTCSRTTKRPIFEFVSPEIHPDSSSSSSHFPTSTRSA